MKTMLPKAISFDIYGTILDWFGGTKDWYANFMKKHGITEYTAQELGDAWEALQYEYIKNYRPWDEILKDSFIKVAQHYGFEYNESEVDDFSHDCANMIAFDDSKKALEDMRAMGIKVCALSNVCHADIENAFKKAGIEMDLIIGSDDVQSYKPGYAHFKKCQEVLGLTADQMHHAAFGFKYDAVPANQLGYTSVWIKRGDVKRDVIDKEDLCFGDLKTYAVYLKGLQALDRENGLA